MCDGCVMHLAFVVVGLRSDVVAFVQCCTFYAPLVCGVLLLSGARQWHNRVAARSVACLAVWG